MFDVNHVGAHFPKRDADRLLYGPVKSDNEDIGAEIKHLQRGHMAAHSGRNRLDLRIGVALQRGALTANHWLALQQRFWPWVNGSLVLLLLTGFLQMTNDTNYDGFLVINSLWAWAMLVKHIAYIGMVVITAYVQFILYPAIERLKLLAAKRPQTANTEQEKLQQKEIGLLRLNLLCATAVLFCTAIATAV